MEGNKYNGVNLESQGANFARWLRTNLVPLFLTALSTWYLFSGAVNWELSNLNWWEKICYICTTMIFGVIITSLVSEGGYSQGKRDDSFVETRKAAIELCDQAILHRAEAELFAKNKIKNDIRFERNELLKKVGLRYEQIFDDNDKLINLEKKFIKKLKKDQKRAIKQAKKIKMYDFTLFGFASSKTVGRKPAPSEARRRKSKISVNLLSRTLTAIVSGSIMFSWIGLSWATVLYSLFQLLLWFGSGLVARIGNYNFVVQDMREYDQERIWILKSFLILTPEELEKLTVEVKKQEEAENIIKIPMFK